MSCALLLAASLTKEHVFETAPARSNHTGSDWVTATRTTEVEEADMLRRV